MCKDEHLDQGHWNAVSASSPSGSDLNLTLVRSAVVLDLGLSTVAASVFMRGRCW